MRLLFVVVGQVKRVAVVLAFLLGFCWHDNRIAKPSVRILAEFQEAALVSDAHHFSCADILGDPFVDIREMLECFVVTVSSQQGAILLQRLNGRLGQKFLVDVCYILSCLHVWHVGGLDLLRLNTIPINSPEERVGFDLFWTMGPTPDSFLGLN